MNFAVANNGSGSEMLQVPTGGCGTCGMSGGRKQSKSKAGASKSKTNTKKTAGAVSSSKKSKS
jgi:hypothetical protein